LRVTGVVRSSRVLSPRFGFLRGGIEQIRRTGLAYAAYLFGATSVFEAMCRTAQRPRVARLAAERAIPMLATRDINNVDGRDFVARADPHVLVSAFFNQRLSEQVLMLPSLGCVNIHPSLLPQFRGADPVFHAKLRRVRRIGVTLHLMSANLDEGNVLAQEEVAVPERASVFAATAELFQRGAELLVERLGRLERRDAGVAQNGAASYDSWPTPAQVGQFRSQGGALLHAADLARWMNRIAGHSAPI